MDKKRAGTFTSNLSGEMKYFSYSPLKLPPKPALEIDHELIALLIEGHRALTVLDEKAKNIPSMDLFISMYVQKEALLSSQIEGTQATLEDIFNPNIDANINADVNDVVNYIKATNYAIKRLENFPLCNRLLLETHQILLSGTRGKEKNPGEFRNSQNWIGGAGSSLRTARYIPPDVLTMKVALSDLEKYMNEEDAMDHLIRAALIHYQFESIHPFLDGNGRIGRLLIVLYLLEKKVIQTPSLYLSYYLKQNRIEYYDRMTAVRDTGNYEQWVKFFMKGVVVSGNSAIETADQLINLHANNLNKLRAQGYSNRTLGTMERIFLYINKSPVLEINKTAEDLKMSYNTIASAVRRLEELGILKRSNNQERNRVYAYEEYLRILSEGTDRIQDDLSTR